jgi:hypothetical protein
MTTGIYVLYWAKQDLTYIGQSQNIELRFKEHIRKLKVSSHTNYKVQNTYNLYGHPELIVVESCSLEESNHREVYWTEEFDSLHGTNGLNIIEAGRVGHGCFSNSSKYSKLQILLAFRVLYSKSYENPEIVANRIGINKATFTGIKSGKNHLWLKDKYPNSYRKMCELNSTRRSECRVKRYQEILDIPILISPTNEEYPVINQNAFARLHNLDSRHVNHVLTGKRKSHKGWKLKKILS